MILEFISANWYLFAMLAVIVLLLSIDPASRGAGGTKKISPLQLPQLQNRESAVVVDICESDVLKKGHIEQAINLPLSQIKDKIAKLNKYKSKPIIISCQTGSQAGKAASILRSNEFSQLYILEGGMAAWKKENLPVVKS
jgi:rhodanese-related sulfurtransferase